MHTTPAQRSFVLSLILALAVPNLAAAQNGFNPFWEDQFQSQKAPSKNSDPDTNRENSAPPQPPYLEPLQAPPRFDGQLPSQSAARPRPGSTAPNTSEFGAYSSEPLSEGQRGVERGTLAPVMAGDGTQLPHELWRGMSVAQIEELIADLEIPPRSTTVHDLWQRLITSNAAPPAGGEAQMTFAAIRSEALFRSGLLDEAYRVVANVSPPRSQSAIFDTVKARAAIAAENPDVGCPIAKNLVRRLSELPDSLTGTATLIIGYCAVHDGNRAAAGLAADLANDHGLKESAGLAALRAYSVGTAPRIKPDAKLSVVDFRILQKVGGDESSLDLSGVKPPLLAALALNRSTLPNLRLAAGEAALAINAISVRDMADIYRDYRHAGTNVVTTDPSLPQIAGGAIERAALYQSAVADGIPLRKARSIRAFLDAARRAGIYWHALKIMAEPANQLSTLPEIAWFAETGIETSLASANYINARRWAAFGAAQGRGGGRDLDHWIGLIDIADPETARGRLTSGLSLIETAAQRGRFSPEQLHRLATVLDALDRQVPIPLWELASRTPQPTTGHLPETGVLSALQQAAKRQEYGHMVLLTMKTLGRDGAEGAHMIALGDSIRALKRAGLKREAQQLGVEALFGDWPRAVPN